MRNQTCTSAPVWPIAVIPPGSRPPRTTTAGTSTCAQLALDRISQGVPEGGDEPTRPAVEVVTGEGQAQRRPFPAGVADQSQDLAPSRTCPAVHGRLVSGAAF